jgi:hypothetical protein
MWFILNHITNRLFHFESLSAAIKGLRPTRYRRY